MSVKTTPTRARQLLVRQVSKLAFTDIAVERVGVFSPLERKNFPVVLGAVGTNSRPVFTTWVGVAKDQNPTSCFKLLGLIQVSRFLKLTFQFDGALKLLKHVDHVQVLHSGVCKLHREIAREGFQFGLARACGIFRKKFSDPLCQIQSTAKCFGSLASHIENIANFIWVQIHFGLLVLESLLRTMCGFGKGDKGYSR